MRRFAFSFVLPFALLGATTCGGSDGSGTHADAGDDSPGDDDAHAGDDGGGPPVGASVLQMHDHANRDGFYVDAKITKTAVATMRRDASFDGAVQGNVYAQPLYVENGPGGKGAFYVATEDDMVFALDDRGKTIWQKTVGTPAQQSGAGCGNISPIGITGTPAIDLATRTIVFDGAVGGSGGDIQTHVIHALSIDDGSEKWSVDVSTLKSGGVALDPTPHNQRSAVLAVGGWAYVAYGGHSGDCSNYHGWIVGVPIATGQGAKAWATPAQAAGMWAPGGPASDGTSVFLATGNSMGTTTWQGGEAILRFGQGATFSNQTADYWAPGNWHDLDDTDTDVGGSGPLVVDAPSMTPSKLVVALGKDGNAYLLDRANLGGVGATPVGQAHVSTGEIINVAAFATVGGATYVVLHGNESAAGAACPGGTTGDLVALKLDPSTSGKIATAWCADNTGQGSPIITTSDGTNDALVWTAGAEASGVVHAWDLATGKQVLAATGAADHIAGLRRFTTLIATKGRVFAGADARLYAFTP